MISFNYDITILIHMDFLTCQNYFQKLIADCTLPPKMEMKLRYLQSVLLQQDAGQYFEQLPEFERQSLRQMNAQTQKAIFIDIINCFASSESRLHFKGIKAKVKKNGSMTDGPSLYLTCIGNRLTIFKKKDNSEQWNDFKLENLQISNLYQQNKKKYTFVVTYGRTQYTVKFDEEGACARVHGQLQNLIRQFKGPQEQRRYERNLQSDIIKQQEKIEFAFDEEAYFLEEEKNFLKALKKAVEDSAREGEEKFKLLRNINNGKLEVGSNGSVRLLLFVQRCEVRRYIQSFVLMDCWNTQVEEFRIIKHLRANSYLAYIKLKKLSMWTAQRQAYVSVSYLKDCICLEEQDTKEQTRNSYRCIGRYYILINTVDYGEAPQSGLVRMKFNQIAEFSHIEDKKDKILLSLTSNVDLNTYEILARKVDINVLLLKDVPSLSILYREKVIQNTTMNLFEFDRCACNIKNIPIKLDLKEQKEEQRQLALSSQKDTIINSSSIISQQYGLSNRQIIKIISDEINYLRNQKIIDIIKKKMHQRYYLKERFDLLVNEQPYIQSNFTLEQDTDFLLLQAGVWKLTSNEQYVFADEEALKIQKGVLKLIIKQITSNILAGKSIMTMSLPVEIFGDKSILDGVVDIMGFVPKYMHQAVQCSSPLEQMKHVAAAFIFIFACHPKIQKPFNPILGQTYQGEVGGIPIFVEQISHHPPISAFYMRNDKFQAYGNFDMHVDLGLNAAYSKNYGLYHVHIFATGTRFVLRFPDLEVGGIMFGNRTFSLLGKGFILEKASNTYMEYSIGKQKKKLYQYPTKLKSSDLVGGIFKITKEFAAKVLNSDVKKTFEGAKIDDIQQKYSQISGKWYGDLSFDGIQYKSLKNGPFPITTKKKTILLPSDSLFREDVIYKRWSDNKRSNEEKEILQNLQRRDKKLRTNRK